MSKKYLIYLSIIMIVGLSGTGVLWYLTPPPAEIPSSYVSQLDSPVRGLSVQEVDDLLNGRGAGYARSAELNSYPGPRHVLDMQQTLDLSPEIVSQVETIFNYMEASAQKLGREIVQGEAELSQGFAERTLSETEMQVQVEELARLYGQLRATHLQAHFQTRPLLSAQQIDVYNFLRGYVSDAASTKSDGHQHVAH